MGILTTAQSFRGTPSDTLEALGRELRKDQESRRAGNELSMVFRCLALAGPGGFPQALQIATDNRVIDRVQSILRAAIPVATLDNTTALAAIKPVSDGFLGLVRSSSAIQTIASAGAFRTVQIGERLGRVESGAISYRIEEAAPKAATRMSAVDLGELRPIKVVAFVVCSSEVFKFGNPLATAVINEDLAGALGQRFDAVCIDELITTSTPSGTSIGDPLADVANLIGNVTLSAASRPYLIGSVDAIHSLALHAGSGGARTFDALGVSGGEILGIPALVSDALTNELILLDAKQIAFADQGLVPDIGRHGTIMMDDTGTGSTPINLFQQNAVAPRLERTFGIAALGTNALAVVTNVGGSA